MVVYIHYSVYQGEIFTCFLRVLDDAYSLKCATSNGNICCQDRSKKFKLFPGNLTMSKNKTQKYVCNYKNVQHLTQ